MYVRAGPSVYVGGAGAFGGGGVYIRCIIMQITVIVLTIIMAICQLMNLCVGLIPWCFYFIEFTNFFLMIAAMAESLITLVYSLVPAKKSKLVLGTNMVQAFLIVVMVLLQLINFVVGIIPWAFYIIEFINLFIMFVVFVVTIVLIVCYFPALAQNASGDSGGGQQQAVATGGVVGGGGDYQNFDRVPLQQQPGVVGQPQQQQFVQQPQYVQAQPQAQYIAPNPNVAYVQQPLQAQPHMQQQQNFAPVQQQYQPQPLQPVSSPQILQSDIPKQE